MIVVGILLAYALPIIRPPVLTTTGSDFGGVLVEAASYALVAVGLNIVIGYAGLLDLGYVGFYAVGAYTTGVLTSQHWHWPFFLALPVAIAVTMVTGVILGAPTLRVRGDYLAIVTLGFGEIIRITINNTSWLGASAGIKDIPSPPSLGPNPIGIDQDGLFQIPHLVWNGLIPSIDNAHKTPFLVFGVLDAIPYYWLLLTVLLIVLFADFLIKESRVGRAWEATREDEDAAELMGVPTFRYKLLAFSMGAAIGGLAGSMLASGQGGYINPTSFLILLSMLFVAAVIIGGAGNRWGAVFGGVLVAYLPERFRALSDWRLLIFGVSLMLIVYFRPQGLLPPRRARTRDRGPGGDRGAGRGGRRCLRARRPHHRLPTSWTARPSSRSTTSPSASAASTALDGVHFDIKQGEILGLIGPNGAGKTTCFNVMTGVYQATSGQVRFDGQPLAGRKRHDITKLGIARTFQNIRLFKAMTALENVMVGADARSKVGLLNALFRTPLHRRTEKPTPRPPPSSCSTSSGSAAGPTSWPRTSPTATSVAWRSPGRWRRSRSCCASTSRRRASTRRRSSG